MSDDYSLYLHIPFCRHRCAYCDFTTYSGQESLIPAYVKALCAEIRYIGQTAPYRLPVHTIYFGGGTPSLLPADAVAMILKACHEAFDVIPEVEISLEANPGSVTLEWLQAVRRLGVNRLSLGMQSAHPDDLRLLERQHDFFDVSQAVRWARRAGFDNLNLDLIYGIPNQSLARWQETLERALGLHPEHLSLYALTIEHATPFYRWVARGLVAPPDDDLAAEMYEWADGRLSQAGYVQYEISNWARQQDTDLRTCRHNVQYWHNEPYLGLGAGAHGFANHTRTANVRGIKAYIDRLAQPTERPFPLTPATEQFQIIDPLTEMQETMLMGLRLTREGVSRQRFYERFHQTMEEVFGATISHLNTLGLLEWCGESLCLTRRGRLLGNRVFMEFVGETQSR
ncbi:radical SAM family heme chaperone HemW [Thermanaerothrix sp.]|jgi:oxygen-independent coproporphyrinogen-3 oxidase|uniref:radical SAM family heme chaperone HemW n=1 Tax=Thermanaerothrix sp. TaxID=2972675 RepID=UPI002ADDC935|nr:radical SAM family heme chaperone HemW [Thermanaerothrix sp.]